MVGMGRICAISAKLRLHTSFGNLVPQLKSHLLVKTIDSLRINGPAVTLEKHMHAPIPITNPCLTDVLDPELQFSLLAAL